MTKATLATSRLGAASAGICRAAGKLVHAVALSLGYIALLFLRIFAIEGGMALAIRYRRNLTLLDYERGTK